VRVSGPRGVRIGGVRFPRANVRSFSFAPNERLPVFEGNPAARFDVTVPALRAGQGPPARRRFLSGVLRRGVLPPGRARHHALHQRRRRRRAGRERQRERIRARAQKIRRSRNVCGPRRLHRRAARNSSPADDGEQAARLAVKLFLTAV
jgi:hypothetical protein